MSDRLIVDRDEIDRFVNAMFRHATGGYVQLRAFTHSNEPFPPGAKWPAVMLNGAGLAPLIDEAAFMAQRCADAPSPIVFCPPVCTLKNETSGAEKDVAEGVALSVECDERPKEACERLEKLLGSATIVLNSGGAWVCPETGEVQDKLHLHWRLTKAASEFAEHVKLKEARKLAQTIVGSDGSAVPLVHPLRWPGSWHRKAEPRLSRIVSITENEINLDEAYALLRGAAAAAGDGEAPYGERQANDELAADSIFDVAACLEAIPNDDLHWDEWNNRIALATWAATRGSDAGFALFDEWSAKSQKYDRAETRKRWGHISRHPPDRIGMGSLVFEARKARPGFVLPSLMFTARPGAQIDEGEDGERCATGAKPNGNDESEAFNAPPPNPTWPELHPDALYGLPGYVVNAISPHSEADPAAILVQYLVAAGNALGRGAYYLVEGDRHGTNLFTVMTGDSAKGRKGTSWGRVRAITEVADASWTAGRIVSGMSSGEGLIWAVRDPIIGYEKQGKGAAAERVAVEIDPGVSDKRLLVIEPEFARAISVMRREGNTLSAVVRDAWDRGTLSSLTKNSPARATGAHISVVGHITTDELRAVLDRTAMANGSANRILWIMVRRSKVLPFGGNMDPRITDDLGRRTGAMISASRNAARVDFDEEARELWRRAYEELSSGRSGLLGAITNRAEAQVIRLALVYALLDNTDAISGNHLRAGLAVWKYAEASCEYIWGDALGNPVADEILRVLRLAGSAGKTRTEIRDLFGRHRSADEIGAALALLAAEGKATCTTRAGANGGRPAELWVAAAAG